MAQKEMTKAPLKNHPGLLAAINKNPKRIVEAHPKTAVLPPVIKALMASINPNTENTSGSNPVFSQENSFGGIKKLAAKKKDSAIKNHEYCAVNENVEETLKYPPAEKASKESPPTLKLIQCEDGREFCSTATKVVGIIIREVKKINLRKFCSLYIGKATATATPITIYKRYCLQAKTAKTGSLKLVKCNMGRNRINNMNHNDFNFVITSGNLLPAILNTIMTQSISFKKKIGLLSAGKAFLKIPSKTNKSNKA